MFFILLFECRVFPIFGSILVKEMKRRKPIFHFAPAKIAGKHINISSNIGVAWRRNIWPQFT